MPLLEVHQLHQEDVYRDIVRINEKHRIDRFNKVIKEGRVCLIQVNGRKGFAVMRGYQDGDSAEIRMDDFTRIKLNVDQARLYEFYFKEVGLIGEWRWAWSSSEIGYRVASRIALISLVLGVAGLLFGIVSIVK